VSAPRRSSCAPSRPPVSSARSAWAAAGPPSLRRPPPTPRRLGAALGGALPAPGQRIGLLGGSFNPAHGGHRTISEEALRRLDLDAVWWLVSPQNPLKPRAGMAPQPERVASARRVVGDAPHIRVTTLEQALGTLYTLDTLNAVTRRMPGMHFVWLMGADNLLQIHRWAHWHRIFERVPVAVFNRPNYFFAVQSGKAAHRFRRARLPERKAARLAITPPPAWVFLHEPRDPRSATAIRARQREGQTVRSWSRRCTPSPS